MKKTVIIIAVLALVSCSDKPSEKEQYAKGSFNDLGGIKVVSLSGTWGEMGRQYGELAGKHLRHVHDVFLDSIIAGNSAKADSINSVAQKLFSRYPYRFKAFMEGVAQSSGMTLEELKVTNAVEYAEGFFCSGMAVWDDYSADGLVYGRNYDAASYAPIGEDVLITVFHPSDGSLSVATIGYAGELYAVNGINEKGIFLALNNGMPSAGSEISFDRFASTTSLLEILFDADNIDYLDAFFKSNRSFASFIIGVADKGEARVYEWCAEGAKRADCFTPEGVTVMTNHYVNPEWKFPRPSNEKSWNSLTRRTNLLKLAEDNKHQIDAEAMCKIMATPVEEGGPMHDLTRYQIVFEPSKITLFIRVESAPQWTEVDMRSFLVNR